jgi:hypothetical protein
MGIPERDATRVGVLVPSTSPPAWIADAVARLTTTGAEVEVLVVDVRGGRGEPAGAARRLRWLSPGGLTGAVDDPDAPRPLEQIDGARLVDRYTHIDVLFCLGAEPGDDVTEPSLGTWVVDGDPTTMGLAETLADAGAVEVALRRRTDGQRRRLSASRVHRLSPLTTRARALWRLARLPARLLDDLLAGRAAQTTTPGDVAAGGGAPRLAARALRTGLRRALTRTGWFVAWCDGACDGGYDGGPELPDLTAMSPLPAPRDVFWADPFPVVQNGGRGDEAVVFVEEWPRALGRGILAALRLTRGGDVERLGTVLQEEWHLSHPHVFDWEGERWLLPESAAAGRLDLYRCIDWPLRWEHERTLMEGSAIVDATPFVDEQGWWLFANVGGPPGTTHDELHLFFADTPLGPWLPHPANPVVSDPRRARPAGRLFREGNRLLRPAQDCGVRYGRALVVHEVTTLTRAAYAETAVARLDPGGLAGANRLHTLNRDGWLTVVDGHRDRWRWT